ncbi:MAG TPA: tRNA (adenosine(37)-N6)-threonylcarbamoyltransferase complex dimerization subunit type 1 TsaB [Candidatus Saccharibacteria bacterium]|nr:tRNA (adenosine(37)-N6)-threonylcarbamoyltransferase complex dimerization subunit type 1 TsaB [Candidatus Saccharibacteria bacterium]HRK93904.1 tRNA (adenosine(37)-N6)-threonylcarbamoyltransferase complex dimerization subunit type 1 TsaB [Candidatus Saccharibacteria bacterium]
MILLLDTSSPVCHLTLVDGDTWTNDEWQADRSLADNLLGYLRSQLESQGSSWNDVTGIGAFQGPGSFTGLRIGLTVLNTWADAKDIPIVGTSGDDWKQQAVDRLRSGENDRLVMPHYGREANITKPRK